MIKEFIEFTSDLFPSISPYTKENVNKAIEQFDYDNLEWFRPRPISYLSQGDIITKLPFTFIDENGDKDTILTKGIILSNTCDIDHDDYIIIAPLIEYDSILNENQKRIVKSNKYYDKMCFTNSQLDGYFIDFTRSTTFNRKLLLRLLKEKTNVEYSLNQYGYYLLLTKLTIYFMRPEDQDTNKIRETGNIIVYS
ncbi:MAG TPA: hypothetical protein IAB58_03800 [Candidatus Pelethosoma merdigallinarum]|nr:hypothetical protein [Candidatus Pelethosoma merdigallinarum]